jgi:hypothetical protein
MRDEPRLPTPAVRPEHTVVPFGRRASPAKVNVMGGDMGAAD